MAKDELMRRENVLLEKKLSFERWCSCLGMTRGLVPRIRIRSPIRGEGSGGLIGL